ncbi:MAG: JAB domain-containing protein [Bacteroidota bacterium]
MKEGAKLGIRLLDHIILTSEGYYSFAGEGLI